jgi:transcriptional regulator with XRE-family HTH domain
MHAPSVPHAADPTGAVLPPMTTLRDLIARHLESAGLSARSLAERTGMSYPTVLSLVNKGHVPRKVEHREALRQALDIDTDTWARVLAASGQQAIDLSGDGPQSLQQIVLKALLSRGHSEQSFAKETGIPYPTVLGVTRKGVLPRADTLARLAGALGLDPAEVERAAGRSRDLRRDGPAPAVPDGTPSLAHLVAAALHRQGLSVGGFARSHKIPYIALMRLVNTGQPPSDQSVLDRLAAALHITPGQFAASLERSASHPEPAAMDPDSSSHGTPLQAALRQVIEHKGLTMKAFAELSELSVLTATRLVKHGALPSRSTTHTKLRGLLGLTEPDYDKLLKQSQPKSPTTDMVPHDEEFQHKETEEITPDGEPREALAPRGSATAAIPTPMPLGEDELADLIGRLTERQKQALKAFLLSML